MSGAPFDQFSKEAWEKLVETPFRVDAGIGTPVALKLLQVVGGPVATRGNQRSESFSLLFLGPADPLLQQKTYGFEHEQTGRFELFIVPVGRRPEGLEYEAVFNRLLNTTPAC